MFDLPAYDGHEKVTMVEDEATGLKAIIAVHSTAMGPAAGGCRLWSYNNDTAALTDALRLSRGMSYKNAMADLPMGGGKAVICGPVAPEHRVEVFKAFGRAVDSLGGQYITAEDVGVSVADMEIIATQTKYVSGLAGSEGKGGEKRAGGDPSPFTARGVRVGIQSAVRAALNRSDIEGVRIAVQGLGHVGMYLCEELARRGARLVVADIDAGRMAEAVERFGATAVSVDDILLQDVDVVAPCALGGAITEDTATHMSARIVAGAANNQLLTPQAGRILARRGILYAPDYVINAGGIIMVAGEISGNNNEADVLAAVDRIGGRLDDIFVRAQSGEALTFEIADQMAQSKIRVARKLKAA